MTIALRHGYNQAIPQDVNAAWGARLIAPADLLHDRQDLTAENEEAERELIDWLNGEHSDGAASKALRNLRDGNVWPVPDDEQFTAYEDQRGRLLARRSGGYVYLAAWIHPTWVHPLARRSRPTVEQTARLHEIARQTGWPVVERSVEAYAEERFGPYEPDDDGPPTAYMLWQCLEPQAAAELLDLLTPLAQTLAGAR